MITQCQIIGQLYLYRSKIRVYYIITSIRGSYSKETKTSTLSGHTTSHRAARRFGYEERSFSATFNQDYTGHRLFDIHQELEDMFQDVIDRAAQHHEPEDKYHVVLAYLKKK